MLLKFLVTSASINFCAKKMLTLTKMRIHETHTLSDLNLSFYCSILKSSKTDLQTNYLAISLQLLSPFICVYSCNDNFHLSTCTIP